MKEEETKEEHLKEIKFYLIIFLFFYKKNLLFIKFSFLLINSSIYFFIIVVLLLGINLCKLIWLLVKIVACLSCRYFLFSFSLSLSLLLMHCKVYSLFGILLAPLFVVIINVQKVLKKSGMKTLNFTH